MKKITLSSAEKIASKTGLWIRPSSMEGCGYAFRYDKREDLFIQMPAGSLIETCIVSLLEMEEWDVVEPDDVMAEFKEKRS